MGNLESINTLEVFQKIELWYHNNRDLKSQKSRLEGLVRGWITYA